MDSLGCRIKARRKELGHTQDDLAARSGISKGFLSDLENGKRRVGADTLAAIGGVLGVSLDHLMTGSAGDPSPPGLDVPAPLAAYAAHAGLPFREVELLVRLRARLPDGGGRFDWQKFHGAIKEFL